MKSYSTVLSNASAEIVIEKSRFIGQSFHVEDLEETENIIKEVKKNIMMQLIIALPLLWERI